MYDVKYFIAKYEVIPECLWLIREFRNGEKGCANGLCDFPKGEFDALCEVFESCTELFEPLQMCNGTYQQQVNNGDDINYQQLTAKERILAALYDIRDKEIQEANVNAAKEIIEVEKLFEIIEPARS